MRRMRIFVRLRVNFPSQLSLFVFIFGKVLPPEIWTWCCVNEFVSLMMLNNFILSTMMIDRLLSVERCFNDKLISCWYEKPSGHSNKLNYSRFLSFRIIEDGKISFIFEVCNWVFCNHKLYFVFNLIQFVHVELHISFAIPLLYL